MIPKQIIRKEYDFAGKKLVLETGELAVQCNMALKASYGDTVMLITAVSGGYNPDIDFFPLTVNYQEKLFAAGSIKSSRFQKRDFRGTDETVIIGRTADHAIRPLFPRDFSDEVQVVGTVLSLDADFDPQVLFMNAVSACLHASSIPWEGPMVSAKVGYVDGEYVLNPDYEVLHHKSELDLIVSFVGADFKFLALEASANVLPEEKVLGAIEFARNNLKGLYEFINDFAKAINPSDERYEYVSTAHPPELVSKVDSIAKAKVTELMHQGLDKDLLSAQLKEVWADLYGQLSSEYSKSEIYSVFDDIKKHALQELILDKGIRPDGRAITEVRPITCKVDYLPKTHGSALFTRGVTQMLSVATLGGPSDELIMQDLYGERTQRYMHHYNFPPYSSGETGRVGGYPKNREIGHGMIGEKALIPVLPDKADFPYTIIVNSETMSSSGSTSMAATCGSSLALMDAGVPIKAMVAGVGVGLIVNDDMSKQLIMTDLAYMEDAYGFLDFKMTGTREGVTAIQSDMKAFGIPMDLLPKIFEQSKAGRMHVLDKMEEAIKTPRSSVNKNAPKIATTKISPEDIGTVIGSGGKNIKMIQEKTGAELSIEEDGSVIATSVDLEKAQAAIEYVDNMFKEINVGEVYTGTVVEILDFGALVEILPGKVGLAHVSELSYEYVKDVHSVVSVGDTLEVKVIGVDPRAGKISLSPKALQTPPEGYEAPERSDRGGRGSRDGGRRDGGRRDDRGSRGGSRDDGSRRRFGGRDRR
ncbi:MAG: polyribonucleotide nucleotidyltransferase [Patescibacteria group bacterium]|uniref:Polyribonucleotide nucleotidyltransferase n=1 Tax=candidate division WWE3 bacterium TaxID=2053526 RepID=A0A955EC42_UNCKA|nr:polyribonucleotide nucleotidyltransferase [candidate division WWE3 bacterium]